MALCAIGKRNLPLHAATTATTRRLIANADASARWVGTYELRELCSRSVISRLFARYPRK